ncbi:MAG: hypothetical protein HDQ88_05395 [Clostridia bacterium]|nr:hypothetical protein [Clostridia bacterium]
MKKFIITLFSIVLAAVVFVFVGYFLTYSEQEKAAQEAINSGIKIDTIMFGVCFNDSPQKVHDILKEFASHNPRKKFEYHFLTRGVNKYAWKWNPSVSFHNDSLHTFRIEAEIPSFEWQNALNVLSDIYSHKYGKVYRSGNEINLYKGNLEVSIYTTEGSPYTKDKISISYRNRDFKYGDFFKWDDYQNSYSKRYWQKDYKISENNIKYLIKDICF